MRKLGIELPALDQESQQRIESLAEAQEHRAALAEAMDRISGAERDAVTLRVIEELDYGEIATRLHCSEGAARTRVHRGLARLSKLMEAKS